MVDNDVGFNGIYSSSLSKLTIVGCLLANRLIDLAYL